VNKVAQMPARDRADLFAETAARKALPEAIIEKDFWVCWMLKQLFSIDALSGRLLFKGGTSLSKIFHAINRFSKDIDLAVDYVALGFKGERDPRREGISKTKRAGILDEMMTECQRYIGGEFLDVLKARCGEILGATGAWSLNVGEQDPKVVQFRYPTAITKNLGARKESNLQPTVSIISTENEWFQRFPNSTNRQKWAILGTVVTSCDKDDLHFFAKRIQPESCSRMQRTFTQYAGSQVLRPPAEP
jgi:hypothetical protein